MEEVMREMAQRRLALKLQLAATSKCVDRRDICPAGLMMADRCPQNAFVLPDRLVGESTQLSYFGKASTLAAERLGVDPGEGPPARPRAKMA